MTWPQPVEAQEPRGRRASIQSYARLAGILGLISVVAGGFGEGYVPGIIYVSQDPAATARNILASESLFRWGFAAYLVEALCDVGLAMAFYVLFRPAHPSMALLMTLFRVVSTAGFGAAQAVYFGALVVLRGHSHLDAFDPGQLDTLAFTLIRLAGFGGSLFTTFYGAATILLGILIIRSGFVPKLLGVLMTLMGIAFTTRTFLLILAPPYASELLLATAVIAFPPLAVWLLVKGVDVGRWQAGSRLPGDPLS